MKEQIKTVVCIFCYLLYFVVAYIGGKYAPLLLPDNYEQPVVVFLFCLIVVVAGIMLVDLIKTFIRCRLGLGDHPYTKSGLLQSSSKMPN